MISKTMFTAILEELVLEYNRKEVIDKNLTKAFGGDTMVIQELPIVDNMLNLLKIELSDEFDFIDWLFYENMLSGSEMYFTSNDIEYKGNASNVYDFLTGALK